MIIIGDIQLNDPADFEYVDEDGERKNFLLEAGLNSVEYCLSKAVEMKEREVVFTGDIFEAKDRLKNRVKNSLIDILEKYVDSLNMRVVVGNHDRNREGHLNVKWLSPYADIYTAPEIVRFDGVRVAMIPHLHDGGEIERFIRSNRGRVDMIIGHFAIDSIKFSGGKKEMVSEKYLKNIPFVVLGHIHEQMKINMRLWTVGSPYQCTFSELTQKYFLKYKGPGLNCTRHKIPLYVNRAVFRIKDERDLKQVAETDANVVRFDIANMAVVERLSKVANENSNIKFKFFNYLPDDSDMVESKIVSKEPEKFMKDFFRESLKSMKGEKGYWIYKLVSERITGFAEAGR